MIFSNQVATASAPVPIAKPLTTEEKIVYYANKHKVSADIIYKVISCESQFNPNAVGDNGHSRGLVQIYDDYHPEVTHEQAFNEDFSIEFLAKKLAQNKGKLWTCYRNL